MTEISLFPAVATPAATDEFVGVQGGVTKKWTQAQITFDCKRTEEKIFVVFESDVSVSAGDGKAGLVIPYSLNGYNLVDAVAAVHTQGVTGTTDIQIRRRRAGSDVDMLSTKITIGAEYFARDGVINTSNDDLATGDMIFVDVDAVHSGTAPLGLSIGLTLQYPY